MSTHLKCHTKALLMNTHNIRFFLLLLLVFFEKKILIKEPYLELFCDDYFQIYSAATYIQQIKGLSIVILTILGLFYLLQQTEVLHQKVDSKNK